MMGIPVEFLRLGNHDLPLPQAETMGAAGIDLRLAEDSIHLAPHSHVMASTGFAIAIPTGYVGLVCPRSGLAAKLGITVLNAPGVIDSDYRGELKVLLHNTSDRHYTFLKGDRIAQLVVTTVSVVRSVEVQELQQTLRGDGGFGSTGVN